MSDPGARRPASSLASDQRSTSVSIRRSPRYLQFIITAVVIFLIVAAILTFVFPVATGFTRQQILGFLLVCGAIVGIAVGGVAAIIADRVGTARARTVQADRLEERAPDGYPQDLPPATESASRAASDVDDPE